MSKAPDTEIQIFKQLVDEFCNSISPELRNELYNNHLNKVKERKQFLNEAGKKSFDESDSNMLNSSVLLKGKRKVRKSNANDKSYEAVIKKPQLIRFEVILKLLDTKYGVLMQDCTLEEIGYVIGTTRERVRQVLEMSFIKIKNPTILTKLNKNDSLESVMDYISLNRKIKS